MVQDTVTYRENNNFKRNDFMQLLMQIKNKGKVEEDHKSFEHNDNGTIEKESGENGMYFCVCVVCKYIEYIPSCSTRDCTSI
jgi:cytochrome P450 family 6